MIERCFFHSTTGSDAGVEASIYDLADWIAEDFELGME
jgi:hypothetical protein